MIYIVTAVFILLISVLEINNVKLKYVCIIFVLFLTTLAGLRVNTGTDFNSYLDFWNYIKPLSEELTFSYGALEPGFVFFISVLKMFTSESVIYFLFSAALAIIPIYCGLKKLNIKYMLVSLLIFYLVFYINYVMNGMRQGISMALFIFSIQYILDNKRNTVFLITLIAASFHISGLFILILYYISKIKININYFLPLGIIISLFFYFTNILDIFLFKIIGIDATVYVENFETGTSTFQIITRSLLVFIFYYFGLMIKDVMFDKLFIMYLIGFFIYIALLDHNMLATRFNMFFRVLEIILVPIVLAHCKNVVTRFAMFILFLIPFSYSFYMTITVADNYYNLIF